MNICAALRILNCTSDMIGCRKSIKNENSAAGPSNVLLQHSTWRPPPFTLSAHWHALSMNLDFIIDKFQHVKYYQVESLFIKSEQNRCSIVDFPLQKYALSTHNFQKIPNFYKNPMYSMICYSSLTLTKWTSILQTSRLQMYRPVRPSTSSLSSIFSHISTYDGDGGSGAFCVGSISDAMFLMTNFFMIWFVGEFIAHAEWKNH